MPVDPARAIGPAAPASATGRAAEPIASEVGTSRAVVAETEMRSEGGRGDTTDRVLATAAARAPPAWDLEVEAGAAVAAGVGGADKKPRVWTGIHRSMA